jgi:PIN domain nuclease of toxin-antitoxin system
VNGFLLDTNIIVFSVAAPERLSASMRRAIDHGPVYLSVLSHWEIFLKSGKGKLDIGDPRSWWQTALERLAATELPLRPEHVHEIHTLPPIHQDPFDRALVAQAVAEELALVTADSAVLRYASPRLIVIA